MPARATLRRAKRHRARLASPRLRPNGLRRGGRRPPLVCLRSSTPGVRGSSSSPALEAHPTRCALTLAGHAGGPPIGDPVDGQCPRRRRRTGHEGRRWPIAASSRNSLGVSRPPARRARPGQEHRRAGAGQRLAGRRFVPRACSRCSGHCPTPPCSRARSTRSSRRPRARHVLSCCSINVGASRPICWRPGPPDRSCPAADQLIEAGLRRRFGA